MRRKTKITILVVLCILAVLCLATPAVGECEMPQWKVGDTWEYGMSSDIASMNLTQEVEELTTIEVNGTNYDVYRVSNVMDMSMYGMEFSYPGENYYRRSDLGMVKTEMSMEMFGFEQDTVAIYSPPKKECSFPMDVGKTWTETCNQIQITYSDGEMDSYDEYESTYEYSCSEMETITVPAGTFECYKIVCEDEWGDESYTWYSPKVKNFVKQSSGDSSDPTEIELKSYEVTTPKGAGAEEGGFGMSSLFEMPYLLFLIIIPIIVVVLAVALVSRSKKKKRTEAEIKSKETLDFVIPTGPAVQTQAAPVRATQRTTTTRPPQRTATQQPPRQPRPAQPPRPPIKAQPKPAPQAPPKPAAQPRPVQQKAPPVQQQAPPPPPPPPPPAVKNPCPTCKQELSLIQQYNRWYCHTCGKYW
jgi:hypothetical protein